MYGMLTQDLRLLLKNRRFYLLMFFLAVFLCVFTDGSFMVGWCTVLLSIFSVSSISYDEYDNCYPFLFTLPLSAGLYVREKYLFGLLLGLGGWCGASLIYLAAALLRGQIPDPAEEFFGLLSMIPILLLIQAVAIPAHLKWGPQKRGLVFGIIGGVCAAGFLIIPKLLGTDASGIAEHAPQISEGSALLIFLLITILLWILSYLVIQRIMRAKEF